MDDKDNTIFINMNDTYGATTSYITDVSQPSYTISINDTVDYNLNDITITGSGPEWWVATPGTHIEIEEVEKMCKEYPALEKVYENFKTIYDLVKQDWESKKDDTKTS